MFKRKGYDKLEKWKISNVLLDWIAKNSVDEKITKDTCDKFAKLFKQVNEIFAN